MAFPSTGILDTFSGTMAGWTSGTPWHLFGPFSIVSGELRGITDESAGAVWNTPFAANDLEMYLTVANGIGNGSEISLRIVNAAVDAHGYMFRFMNHLQWDLRRLTDDFSSTVLTSATMSEPGVSVGDKIGFRRIGQTLTGWHYTGGAWVQITTANDNTYTDMTRIGLHDYAGANHYDDFGGGVAVSGPTLDNCLPDADVTTTGWTTAPLFSKVNDASDSTVIQATAV